MEFLGHRRPAHDAASLQHPHLQTRPRQIERTDKPVMAAANQHRVIGPRLAVPQLVFQRLAPSGSAISRSLACLTPLAYPVAGPTSNLPLRCPVLLHIAPRRAMGMTAGR